MEWQDVEAVWPGHQRRGRPAFAFDREGVLDARDQVLLIGYGLEMFRLG